MTPVVHDNVPIIQPPHDAKVFVIPSRQTSDMGDEDFLLNIDSRD
jgi:hypothetical protein